MPLRNEDIENENINKKNKARKHNNVHDDHAPTVARRMYSRSQAEKRNNQTKMKLKLIQILSIIIMGLIVNSCSVKKDIGKIEGNIIKILNVDSLKFENYYTCEFKSKNITAGHLLIKKSKTNLTSSDLLISEKIRFDDLCDVIEFQPNNSEITFRGHATINGIYEDGELIIDLSNDVEKRYYQLCYGNQIERKN